MEKVIYKRRFKEDEDVNFEWHLPSKEVLNAVYENKNELGRFADYNYWSSSENGAYNAWSQIFYDGYQNYNDKDNPLYVRAVRALENDENVKGKFYHKGQAYQVYPKDAPKLLNWVQAMKYCKSLN